MEKMVPHSKVNVSVVFLVPSAIHAKSAPTSWTSATVFACHAQTSLSTPSTMTSHKAPLNAASNALKALSRLMLTQAVWPLSIYRLKELVALLESWLSSLLLLYLAYFCGSLLLWEVLAFKKAIRIDTQVFIQVCCSQTCLMKMKTSK